MPHTYYGHYTKQKKESQAENAKKYKKIYEVKKMITKNELKNYLTNGGATLQANGKTAHFSRGYQVAGIAPVAVVPVALVLVTGFKG